MINSRDFLHQILEGETPDVEQAKEFFRKAEEDQHLDFKSGKIFDNPEKKPSLVLREYVAGFANADGGVLVFGVHDKTREFDECPPKIGGSTLWEWASKCLSFIGQYMSPIPRILTLTLDGKKILLVGCHRNSRLVPYVDSGQIRYSLRIGESTLTVPEYLLNDLLLGRRARPRLSLREVSVANMRGEQDLRQKRLVLRVANQGLNWAPDVIAGVLYMQDSTQIDVTIGDLRERVECGKHDPAGLRHMTSARTTAEYGGVQVIYPFCEKTFVFDGVVADAPTEVDNAYFAVYLIPRGSPAQFFEVELPIRARASIQNIAELTNLQRPRVGWNHPTVRTGDESDAELG